MTGSGGPGGLGEPADSGALGGGAAQASGPEAQAQADEDRAVAQALALVSRPSPRDAETTPVDAPSDWLTSLHDDWPDAPAPGERRRTPAAQADDTPWQSGEPGNRPAAPSEPGHGGNPLRDADCTDQPERHGSDPAPSRPGVSPAGDRPGPRPRAPRHAALPWPAARSIATRAGQRGAVRTEWLGLGTVLGRVLGEPLAALTDLPSFDTSAMDGWAVAGPGPWRIQDGGGILAGHGAPAPLPDGEAVRIATGARIPAEGTAVIRSEHAHADEAKGLLYAERSVSQGQDIRPRGQECRSGEILLPAGTVVTPAVLGLAAAAGYDELPVRVRPRVDVLVLGDELLTAGLPHDGLIRDALGPMIGPWVHALGAEVTPPRRLGDDAEALEKALTCSEADLIITTGGTAAGPVDHVHRVLGRIGAELLVDGVAVRPGHPMLLARLPSDGPWIVGLPGNPLAAVSGLLTLAGPLLGGLAGRTPDDPYRVAVRDDVHGHPHDTRLVPVVHRAAGEPGTAGGAEHVVPLHYNGPAMLRGIAAADGLAVVEPGGVRSGTEVEILDLPWAPATPWTEGCFT
ncbi:molybdenum cofactor biosynthesis protein MoeA [Streptomyces sp. CB01249]|uniref:molybdopterin molybdotransferase MoeA n=1 Tax=Streptomyces sp. CB01249 TaxID=1703929 RepID=UPI00093DCD99|nr:molybdopterin molybdotransferase MoeA [Streptomyces sp. CB01249]OKI99487.1 molybdenum cofactor biosynthesis protein MoeA [Streptomyces sp. CB01249]